MKKKGTHSKKPAPLHARGRSLAGWICICAIAVAGLVFFAGYVLHQRGGKETAEAPRARENDQSVWRETIPGPERHERTGRPGVGRKEAGAANRVAFVIDDMGYDVSILYEILALDIPVTISILPFLPHSATVADEAHRAGREVLLHLPMEPHDYPERCPGDGALLLRMNGDEIVDQLEKDILSVPHISGVNNHMGSGFMEDEEKVTVTLRELKRRGLFFLDSLTTRNSKGLQVAARIGLPRAGRDIFLDNDCDFEEALDILNRIVDRKTTWSTMIIIGHPYESTVRAIGEAMPLLREHRIRIVPLSDLIE
ncbi:MAG: divergent polysaccharide deacetylase family protein [Deltaproteobacteria bacterium]|nr:divergent polysaccharide deacetylase family protein [Deltaproteobacteria bacterium]